jgi:hypothetical protein
MVMQLGVGLRQFSNQLRFRHCDRSTFIRRVDDDYQRS